MLLFGLSGCGEVTFGPRTTNTTTFVSKYDDLGRPVKTGRITKNIKVEMQYETEDKQVHTTEVDVGGWYLSPPPTPTIQKQDAEKKDAEIELPAPKKVTWYQYHYFKAMTVVSFPPEVIRASKLTMLMMGIQPD